ncbi:hypothetical protein Bca4012_084105 [Brassica carinata]|uniref:Uncharacterized protein n=1 Tax=Brassica carinata TaxID=52824 RepID=A0A8X7SL79_BRACI|nr:hypothetical protein Bca52824_026687 [Brassica carinata]
MRATGRKRLRNRAPAGTSYGNTFLGQTSDPSASTSGTSSAHDNVPEIQIPSVPYVPPPAYDPTAPDPYYPQFDDHDAYFPVEEQHLVSLKNRVEYSAKTVPPDLIAPEREEAKAVLKLFFKKQGLSNSVSVRLNLKSLMFDLLDRKRAYNT